MIGALITAGASLLGGLFGSKKKKETTKTETVSKVDYKAMREGAEAEGFNPLTALRNGGSAGFSSSTSTTTSPTVSSMPGALASIGGILGEAFEKKIDPLEAKKRQLDTALVDYQLRQLKQGPTAALYPGSTYTGTKVNRQLVAGLGPSVGKVAASPATRDNPRGYQQQPAQQTMLFGDKPGAWWQHHPLVPDMATFEDVYGDEVGQVIGAPIKLAMDLGYNLSRAQRAVRRYTDPYVLGAYNKAGSFWKNLGGQTPAEHKALLRGLPQPAYGGGW